MPAPKQISPPPGSTPADAKWRHYNEVLEKFRALCHGDVRLFEQAQNHILAKRVVEVWDREGRPFVDGAGIAKAMWVYQLDAEDERQVDALYRRKLAFRDKIAAALGKREDESWDSFYGRFSAHRTAPNMVRQFELMAEGVAA